jgi:hypothetical protein
MVWIKTGLRARGVQTALVGLVLLFSASLCDAQTASVSAPEADYTRELVTLITGLQKNPWRGWSAGTEVTVTYIVERDAAGKPLGKEQPDVVFKVTEMDKLFEVTQIVKSKPVITEFLVKDEEGLAVASRRVTEPTSTELQIDGFKLSCLVSEMLFLDVPGRVRVTKEWVLASHPSVVLGKEVNDEGWRVTSARVKKSVGDKEFSCVEIKKSVRFYSDGPSESVTTQYRCPGVPGHVVEEIQELFKFKKEQRTATPFQVVHQKVTKIKLPG